MRIRLRPLVFATAAVLFVAAAVAGSLTGYRYWSDRQTEQARTDSAAAARHTMEAMFSYDFRSVDTELPKVVDNLDGGFRDIYAKIIHDEIIPGAKQKQLTVQATAQAAGVISAQRDHAVILVFLNQVTTSKDAPKGTVTSSRVRVNMDKAGGRWLAAQVTPI
ncbi:h domain protein [Nocardia sp. NPDC051570]|uniref:h domain protein n=1 Tax=Nocardia sp. NPDC051570 TaxID=3364324 RepID=UPI0037A3F3D4